MCCCRFRFECDDEDDDKGEENVDSDRDAGFFALLRARALILLCSTRASCSYCAMNSRKEAITASDSLRSLLCVKVCVRGWVSKTFGGCEHSRP